MKNVDVEIYISQLKTFFDKNPGELNNLVHPSQHDEFYVMVKKIAFKNYEDGEDIPLTRTQYIEICKDLFDKLPKVDDKPKEIFVPTEFGGFYLN